MSNHKHSCSCSHAAVKYCSHCRTVFCQDCSQEWSAKLNHNTTTTWTYPQPWYTSGNILSGGNTYHDVNKGAGATSGQSGSLTPEWLAKTQSMDTCKHK